MAPEVWVWEVGGFKDAVQIQLTSGSVGQSLLLNSAHDDDTGATWSHVRRGPLRGHRDTRHVWAPCAGVDGTVAPARRCRHADTDPRPRGEPPRDVRLVNWAERPDTSRTQDRPGLYEAPHTHTSTGTSPHHKGPPTWGLGPTHTDTESYLRHWVLVQKSVPNPRRPTPSVREPYGGLPLSFRVEMLPSLQGSCPCFATKPRLMLRGTLQSFFCQPLSSSRRGRGAGARGSFYLLKEERSLPPP